MNTSATGGYLIPTGTEPLNDAALVDVFQAAIVGITGLTGSKVRSAWQNPPPKQPAAGVDWAFFQIVDRVPDDNVFIGHDPAGDGKGIVSRHETIDLLITFYGNNCHKYATRLRDGLAIPQNTEAIRVEGLFFIGADTIRNVPELFNKTWFPRVDLPLVFRRKISNDYALLNLLTAPALTINTQA